MPPSAVILILGLIVILFISVIVYVISKLVFDSRTNKALANGGNGSGRKMLNPVQITSIVAVVMLVGLLMVSSCYSMFSINRESGIVRLKENSVYDIGIIFEMEEDSYTPDPDKYINRAELKSEGEVCLVYAATDNEVNPVLIVYKIKDASEISKAEISFIYDDTERSKFLDFGNEVKGLFSTSLQDIEFPGVISITLQDKDGKEVSSMSMDL
ncbi:MAG: hypothetical protein J6W36_03990 [Clostridiales bacterium]|nr:hypothetical protein [Clostridiales bacterium]